MKRVLVFAVFVSALFLSACEKDYDDKKISQLRGDIFIAETENVVVYAYSERVEDPLKDDGYVGNVKTRLTFKIPFTPGAFASSPIIAFNIGEKNYSKEFDFTPASNYNYCSVEVESLPIGGFSGVLRSEDKEIPLDFTSLKVRSAYDCDDVIRLAFKTEAARKFLRDENEYEIRVRLIESDGFNYWYIGFIKKEDGIAFLFDAENAEIIATKRL